MKYFSIILCTMLFANTAFGQDDTNLIVPQEELETIEEEQSVKYDDQERPEVFEGQSYHMNTLLKKPFSIGAFLEYNMRFAQFDNQEGVLAGGQLSLVLNHSLNIGVGGYGLISPIDYTSNNVTTTDNNTLLMGYGGIIIEPEFLSEKVVHISTPVLLGAGGFGYHKTAINFNDWDESDWKYGDAFWVVEPGVSLMINISRMFKVGVGGSYRYTSEVVINNNENIDRFNGFSGNLSLRFGWF